MVTKLERGPLIAAGTLIGAGMGGFVDGILFHQLLQVHNMLSAKYPRTTLVNVEVNMFWDGLFHALTWSLTAIGIALLWRCGQRADVPWSTRTFLGSLVVGVGMFNLVEGIIDHHILNVHHVVERLGPSIWDLAFLAVGGVLLILVGWALIRSGRDELAVRGRTLVSSPNDPTSSP
jgi:uncharacterized membrane protein